MSRAQPVNGPSRELDLLNKIEELRGHLLQDQGIRERISQRAYELHELRGGEPGRDVEDWVLAENEILSPLIEEEIRSAGAAHTQAARGSTIYQQELTGRKLKGSRNSPVKKGPTKSKGNQLKALVEPKEKAVSKGKSRKKKVGESSPSAT